MRRSFHLTILGAAAVVLLAFAAGPTTAQPAFTRSGDLNQPATVEAIETTWAKGIEGFLVGQRDVRIAYRVFKQPNVETERGAIVIVSGRTESMLKYKETIHDLWNRGYSIYIHDHRGQGLSAREPHLTANQRERGHVIKFDYYIDDLRAFIADKVLSASHRNLYLLAHSMGGAIATRFIESNTPDTQAFRAAVLSSPMLGIKSLYGKREPLACGAIKTVGDWFPTRTAGKLIVGDGYRRVDFGKNDYTDDPIRYKRLVEQVEKVPAIKLGPATYGWAAQACTAADQARADSGKVKVPIHAMVAGSDEIVDNRGTEEFCKGLDRAAQPAGCGGPSGGPLVVAGAKHELFIERDALRDEALNFALKHFEGHRR